MSGHEEVPVEKLRKVCEPSAFNFETTEDVRPLAEGIIGQERAVRSVEFGLGVRCPGYNIYMAGPTGTGKSTYARAYVEKIAARGPVPKDWCYVYNFDDPGTPIAIGLPPGLGRQLSRDMDDLVDDLKTEIPKAVEGEDFEEQRNAIIKRFQQKSTEVFSELERLAEEQGFALKRGSAGFLTIPLKDGRPMNPEEYSALPEEEQLSIQEKGEAVQSELAETARRLKILEKETKEEISELEKKVVLFAIEPYIRRLQDRYREHPRVTEYLEKVKEDVVRNLADFKTKEEGDSPSPAPWLVPQKQEPSFTRYKVNLLVNNADATGAPVVVETNPTYYNLFGSIEYKGQLATLVTDFTMIKPGAIHRANGGYLILQAKDVLSNFLSWDSLKRALKNDEIRIENIGEQYRMVPTTTLRPEPIPLDVKVILIGSPFIYHLLYIYDEDFRKFFKIKADFDVEMERSGDHIQKYAEFISSVCRREGLRHFDRGAVAKVVEYSSRIVGNQEKLSTRFNEVVELVYESCAWSERDNSRYVRAEHVEKAIEEKVYRSNLIEEKLQQMIDKGKILVDTDGEKVGQVNGLAILNVGDYVFGKPSRITAKTFLGEKGVVNIEREIKLSGNIHSKGVMILSGYLGAQYGSDKPLSLSASLCFEQLYEEVDGDSASSTELYALLSSLSGLPIRQYLAVTGSVNQHGEIQPIGGVTQKIEGFFAVCKARGLTGKQGVLIPHQNVDDLMLKKDVVEAVRCGTFHIYPVRTVDEGIELLTGVPAGQRREDGSFPEGTVHYLVDRRLREMAETLRRFGKDAKKKKDNDPNDSNAGSAS